MFFIGGFNSVIPYVVYLSLIWTFVILSFGGKIAAMLHKQPDHEIASPRVVSKSCDDHYLQFYYLAPVKEARNITTADTPGQLQLSFAPILLQHIRFRYVSPPLASAEPYSFLFRGPPLFC
jgi:hypothetical protein